MIDKYQKVREEIAVKISAAIYEVTVYPNYVLRNDFSQFTKQEQAFLLKHVDRILSLPALVIKADDQSLPENIYANERDFKVCKGTQGEMIRKHFVKVIDKGG